MCYSRQECCVKSKPQSPFLADFWYRLHEKLLHVNTISMYIVNTKMSRFINIIYTCIRRCRFVNYCRTLCGVILFLCFVGTGLDVISDCMKPTNESSLSKNDSFMPVKRINVEYESSLVDSPATSTTHLNSTQSSQSCGIPLLVHDRQEGTESTV